MSTGRFVKFLDHPLLPAELENGINQPRIIESGLTGEGEMDPNSPHVTAADGIATLFYRLGQEKWLEKMLNADNVYHFEFFHKDDSDPNLPPLYAERNDHLIEIGTFGKIQRFSVRSPGAAFGIEKNGNWLLLSSSDREEYCKEPKWIQALSEYIGRKILDEDDKRWKRGIIHSITWSDKTKEEKRDIRVFKKKFAGEVVTKEDEALSEDSKEYDPPDSEDSGTDDSWVTEEEGEEEDEETSGPDSADRPASISTP